MFDRLAREREKPLLDDDELQQLISDRLDEDPVFHLASGRRARLNVEVDDGKATLRGLVRTALDRRRADITARALGATTVDNQLAVEDQQHSQPRTGRRRKD